jgi:hypothetical protein
MEKGKEKRDAAERQAKAKVGVLEAKASKLKSVAAETRI